LRKILRIQMTLQTKLVGVGVVLTVGIGAVCMAATTAQPGWLLTAATLIVGAALTFGVPALVAHDMVRPVSRLVGSLSENTAEEATTAAQVGTSAQKLSPGGAEEAAA